MKYLECDKCDNVDVEEDSGPYNGGPCGNPECTGTFRPMKD